MTTPTAGGKGRPTPKRSEKVRRQGPVAPPPLTRKEAAQRQKEQLREQRQKVRTGQARGDERFLPKRDAGPVRALVRDVVDSRRNAGVLLLPVALLLVVSSLVRVEAVMTVAITVWMAALLTALLDSAVLARAVSKKVRDRFPEVGRTGGHIAYALLRSTVFRRWRMPPPAVAPGERP